MPTQGRPALHATTAVAITPDGELAALGLATAAVIAALLTCPAATAAENFACTLAPSSVFSQTTDLSLPLAGTWIGNYDAVNNPTGTKTIPGLFGGSGNNPIPFSGTLKPRLTITDAHPAGTFGLSIDPSAGTAAISGLSIDILNGQPGTIANTIVLSFSTFRTQQPSSTFFGISNVSIPVSNDAITAATLAQSADAVGTAIADGLGGWTVAVLVPVDITVSGTALGAPFDQVFAGAFALSGSASSSKGGIALSLQAEANETGAVAPAPPLVAVPFALPTILPAGSTANLLMNATFSEGSVTSSLTTTIVATGVSAEPNPDINGDGIVGGPDLAILLAAWDTANAAADLNGNGLVDGPDLSILLAAWQ